MKDSKQGVAYKEYFFLLFIVFCLLPACFCFAQQRKIDSLLTLLKKDKEDTNKVNHLNTLGWELMNSNPDTAIILSTQALALANSLLDKSGEDKDRAFIANSLGQLGVYYRLKADYPKSLDYCLKALRLDEKMNNKRGIAIRFGNIGLLYWNQADYSKTLEYYFRALKIFEELGDKNRKALTLGNIGNVYTEEKDYPKALDYYFKALKMNEEIGNKISIAIRLGNIGFIYNKQGDYPRALAYYMKALKMAEDLENKNLIAINLGNIGSLYILQKKYAEAEKHLLDALRIDKEIGAIDGQQDDEEQLSELYTKTNRYQLALQHYKKAMALKDTIFSQENKKQLVRKEMQFDFDKKTEAVKAEQEKKDLKTTMVTYSISAGLVLVLLLALLIFRGYIQKQRANRVLAEKNKIIEDKNAELFRLSLVASKTNNAIIIMDNKGNLEWINEAFTGFSGHTLSALFEANIKTIFELSTHPNIRQIFNNCAIGKKPVVYESKHTGKDNAGIWIVSTLSPVLDSQGEINKFIIISTDITDRKNAEDIIKEKNKDITDSIKYAKRIQEAILPAKELKHRLFPDVFVIFQPKDVVCGDFYWFAEKNGRKIIAAVDCTGHGVPGALMSMIGNAFLNEIISEKGITKPGEILDKLCEMVISSLKQSATESESKDGMDIAICSFNSDFTEVEYAGANNPFWKCKMEEGKWKMEEIQANKQPIGIQPGEVKPFTNHIIKLQKGDSVYIFTDGYADQFGGEKGKKFKYRHLQEVLLSIQDKKMHEQETMLVKTINNWRGNLEQVDDILVIGVRV